MVNCFANIMNTPFMIYIGVGFHKRQTYEHFLPGGEASSKSPQSQTILYDGVKLENKQYFSSNSPFDEQLHT
jgi:hypothetical protein